MDRKGFEPLTSRMPCAHPTRLNDRPISNGWNETNFVNANQHLTEFIKFALGRTHYDDIY